MSDSEYLTELRRGSKLRGEPEPDEDLLTLLLPVLRADVALSCAYMPLGAGGHAFDITTIGWTADQDVGADAMSEWSRYGLIRHTVLLGNEFAFRSAPDALRRLLVADLSLVRSVPPLPMKAHAR